MAFHSLIFIQPTSQTIWARDKLILKLPLNWKVRKVAATSVVILVEVCICPDVDVVIYKNSILLLSNFRGEKVKVPLIV